MTSSIQFCSRSSFWCPRPSKSCLKPVECQNSTTLSSHSTGTTQSHMVIRRKLLYLNIPPLVTWLWKKGLSVFQRFTKFSRKKLFCLLDEVCFSQGILDWVNEHNLVFLFSCLALHSCNRTLPHEPSVLGHFLLPFKGTTQNPREWVQNLITWPQPAPREVEKMWFFIPCADIPS